MILNRVLLFSLALLSLTGQAMAGPFDFSAWNGLVKDYAQDGVKDGVRLTLVDYRGLGADPRFKETIAALASYSPSFAGERERIAFWVNVYNIFAAGIMTAGPSMDSIKDAGGLIISVWKKEAGVVGGKSYSLDDIEHGILRKLGDPRIHGAIVCASVSCPDLRMEAFDPVRLDEQLDGQMKAFLGNETKGLRLDYAGKKVMLSKIFKWFSEDFDARGGVRSFVAGYLPRSQAAFVLNPDAAISYMDYNWRSNGR